MSIIWKNEFKGKGKTQWNQRRGQIWYKNMNIDLKNLMLPGWRLGSNWLKKGKFDSEIGSFISHQGKGEGKIWGQNT